MNETIIPDQSKHYLLSEPFFITDSKTGEVHILRGSNVDIFGKTIRAESK